ncbi:MAG: phosphoribosyl-AMP cyclohydrolase / phosphoribosyl-ATP pyrophosphohydrolase [Candidatus Methanomethylophilaceae archaeon]|nr:phosphoribosyl-AMP cyclohydrolase / phosphoribosyl-ATP pyrophosphohydrolase [Candidatus Methanomethylophilaceae archaeon]MDI3542115.1 phosphoribosyl-AMP cyclohydrolase / phosphoribosyl-ATP pyrophosphohydrolase [Candidatus Methanomethylophilaceae archaeon]HIJ00637.1 bifunctional phosphoribosyl-AMP cyclohydrolase/phosphoribosyl-ATP diphosphatase HisIE [Candidatus Methanomethylophilaceae archaeon]
MTELRYDPDGLIPVVVQDYLTNEVLMVAWANREALNLMMETGETHFWSRSRQEIWHKGESSGNVQKIKSIETDCDRDTLLVRVEQVGVACHTGEPTCFYEVVEGDPLGTMKIIPDLLRVIKDRRENPKEASYTNRLMNNETLMCKKIIEEAGELALAIKDDDEEEMAWELADLIYHVLVALVAVDMPLESTFRKLAERRK